jgi:UDP-glucose 4-epimerase
MLCSGKTILVTGGTGSLGKATVRRLLAGELGTPGRVVVFSRDEAKQHDMRLEYLHRRVATDDVIYENFRNLLSFRIGDVRDYPQLASAVREADIVVHAAALKQVPTCEYFPSEAVQTNINGAINLVRALREIDHHVECVIGISTDKACKPVNVMGMTKALQERVLIEANLTSGRTRIACVRYGNVIASRGSVVPLFADQIATGGPVTITSREMTRFLLTLDEAVDTIFAALRGACRGEIYVPRIPAARIVDLARLMIGDRDIPIVVTGVRPGEKVHEIMVSEEECGRTVARDGHYVVKPALPELRDDEPAGTELREEFTSASAEITEEELRRLLEAADAGVGARVALA